MGFSSPCRHQIGNMRKSEFTHYAWFYLIPCYIDLRDEDCPTLAGRNVLFDMLIPAATFFHNYFVQPFLTEPKFPIIVLGEIK